MDKFIKGMDVSTLPEETALGAKYYDEGKEGDALEILKKYGANSLRIRLWNDPYSEDGKPYGAGTSDFTKLVALASAGKKLGYSYLLDLHYSDFWADPGKQFPPKEWAYADANALEKYVYDYTKDVLLKLKRLDLLPEMVQVGNEITNGLMWPHGKWDNVDNIARFISAGIRAVREISPDSRVMLHLDCGGNNARCREWFDAYVQRGEDFDVIGLSYYPFWHGTYLDLQHSMEKLIADYGKPIILAETAYAWRQSENGFIDARQIEIGGLPASPEGQLRELETVMHLTAALPDKLGRGIYYWEPLCVPKAEHGGWSENMGLLDEKGCAMQGFLAYLQTREEMERVPAGFEELMEKVRNTVSEAGSYSGENKVKNGDFLEFTSDWEITGSETAKLTFEEGEPGCTSRILRLESPKKFRFCMKQKINLAPGETYRLSVEAKGVDTTGVEVCLFAGAPEENTEEEQRVMIHPTENWKQYSLTGKAGEDGQMVLGIRVDSPAIYLCIRQIWLT